MRILYMKCLVKAQTEEKTKSGKSEENVRSEGDDKMGNKVTVQDIADALGVSRNTVSKAINNTGILADATREKVLKKAVEMGYKQFSHMTDADIAQMNHPPVHHSATAFSYAKSVRSFDNTVISTSKEIALFTTRFSGDSHFSSSMLDKFQRELSALGYSLSMHRVLPEELKELHLPQTFQTDRSAGIVCYGILDPVYSQMICTLNIPALFIDSPVLPLMQPLQADKLFADNQSEIYSFIREMAQRDKKYLGFVGEYRKSQSFFERYMGFQNALHLFGLPFSEDLCFLGNKKGVDIPDSQDYQEYLTQCIRRLRRLPDVFVCANDFIAINMLKVLQSLGYSVPEDVYLCGFDDSLESQMIEPSLTSIHVHSEIMGDCAVQLLMSRIKNPSLNYRTVYTETNLIYRKSTEN